MNDVKKSSATDTAHGMDESRAYLECMHLLLFPVATVCTSWSRVLMLALRNEGVGATFRVIPRCLTLGSFAR